MSKKSWAEKLTNYVNKKATFQSIGRATMYSPMLVTQQGANFELECSGSMEEPYHISIWETESNQIASDCSCPYSQKGICKHVVASINLILEGDHLDNIDEDEQRNSTTTETLIPCKDGVLIEKEINKIPFNSSASRFNPVSITSISKSTIEGNYDDFRHSFDIELRYDSSNDKAVLSCSCDFHKPCAHKERFIDTVIQRFGTAYFSKDYRKEVKKDILQRKNLAGKIDFDKVFKLEVTPNGISFSEKVTNVQTADAPLQLIDGDKNEFYVPHTGKKQPKYGVGFCFELYNKELQDFYPFTGKMNKAQTRLSSRFEEVFPETVTDALDQVNSTSDKNFLLAAVQASSTFEWQFESRMTVEDYRELHEKMAQLIPYLSQVPLFLKNGAGSFVRHRMTEVQLAEKRCIPTLKITEKEGFYALRFMLKIGTKKYEIKSDKLTVTPIGIFCDDLFYPFHSAEEAVHVMYALNNPAMHVIKDDDQKLRENIIQPLAAIFEIEFEKLQKVKKVKEQVDVEKQLYLSDLEEKFLVLRPMMKYGDQIVQPGSNEKLWADRTGFKHIERRTDEEADFLNLLSSLHPNFKHQRNFFYLSLEEALESMWIMETIDKLREKSIAVLGLNKLSSIRYNLNKPSFSMNLSSGTDWFDMDVEIKYGDETVDLKSLQKAIVKQSNYVELSDGSLGLLPKEWVEKYKKYFKVGQVKKDKIEISNFQFNIIDELYEDLTNKPVFLEELYKKKKRLQNLSELKNIRKPRGLKAKLRPYQKQGLNWMAFLDENKLGGCLADDMGLGKTIQTIAFLLYLKHKTDADARKPSIVVAPTSLMFNWQAEIEKFAPDLKTLVFTGPKRKALRDSINNQDVILTTYGSLIKDITYHKKNHYAYAILDESQAIKNPQSQRFKAVRLLQCDNRLALTGTPIENNTFDLYSQFNFLNPGIFGSIKHFRSTFSDAIDKEQDADTSDLLARMIDPFILRRTKEQVAHELPAKTESVLYCEMGQHQQKVYDEFKKYFRQKLMQQIEDEGVNKSQMYILQGLTKLRQICNSTALADKEKDYGNASAKLDELVRHLNEKVTDHKVLVFSQFVGMLNLVKERLQQENITFEYLDGQTGNREQKVNHFQENDDIRVFLISLKAGGTGLNLTEADYVYLIDPWWNPAVESQAIDRCYRIGQHKKVMAYRMICKGTIEDKIVKLQDKKKSIASDVIRVDKEKKSFNKKDVALFFD
ncbi:MAG: SNF2-related protein [Bacteroidota bacterium]